MRALTNADARSKGSRWPRTLEHALLATGIVCLTWYGWRTYQIHRRQSAATVAVERALATPSTGVDVEPPPGPLASGIIGELEIPRLHVSAPVQAGDDDSVLDVSVGYLPDTPLPWATGNSAFAAHRDRLFRPIEHIREGDAISLSTQHGNLRYRVLRTLIVNPEDVWVLGPLPKVSLTLITCYPFQYVGHAPHRFIVQAEKLD